MFAVDLNHLLNDSNPRTLPQDDPPGKNTREDWCCQHKTTKKKLYFNEDLTLPEKEKWRVFLLNEKKEPILPLFFSYFYYYYCCECILYISVLNHTHHWRDFWKNIYSLNKCNSFYYLCIVCLALNYSFLWKRGLNRSWNRYDEKMLIKESERATMDPQKDVCLQIFGKQIFNSFLESLSLSPS